MPLMRSVPEESGARSAMARRRVVLPQPEGPMRETKSPFWTVRSTSERAMTGLSAALKMMLIFSASMTVARWVVVAGASVIFVNMRFDIFGSSLEGRSTREALTPGRRRRCWQKVVDAGFCWHEGAKRMGHGAWPLLGWAKLGEEGLFSWSFQVRYFSPVGMVSMVMQLSTGQTWAQRLQPTHSSSMIS